MAGLLFEPITSSASCYLALKLWLTRAVDHPSVRATRGRGALGVLSVKKTPHGLYVYYAHNTDSFVSVVFPKPSPHILTTLTRLSHTCLPKTRSQNPQCLVERAADTSRTVGPVCVLDGVGRTVAQSEKALPMASQSILQHSQRLGLEMNVGGLRWFDILHEIDPQTYDEENVLFVID